MTVIQTSNIIKDRKEALLFLIRNKGLCYNTKKGETILCMQCPLSDQSEQCSEFFRYRVRYLIALERYIREYGEGDLMEELL